MSVALEKNEYMTSSEAKEIFRQTRPADWPAPANTYVTVTAKVAAEGHVSISWKRDDLVAAGGHPSQITFTAEEFREIAAAVSV